MFDIHDQQAIEVQSDAGSVTNHEYVSRMIHTRMQSLRHGGSRTAVTAYRESVGSGIGSGLPIDGWEYLARRGGLEPLVEPNVRAGNFVFHLARGVGEIVEHWRTTRGDYEVRVIFEDGPMTLIGHHAGVRRGAARADSWNEPTYRDRTAPVKHPCPVIG